MLTLDNCIAANRPCIFVVCESDVEVLRYLNEKYNKNNYSVYSTTLARVVKLSSLLDTKFVLPNGKSQSTLEILSDILTRSFNDSNNHFETYVFLDSDSWINDRQIIRKIKDILSRYQLDTDFTVNTIFVSQTICVPPQLERLSEVVFYNLPNEQQLKDQSDSVVEKLELKKDMRPSDEVVNNLKGLTLFEVEQAYLQSWQLHQRIDLDFIRDFKKASIAKTDLLSLMETNIGFDNIGGLETLKTWITKSGGGWTVEGKKYGLPLLKGLLLVGLPGCGKAQPLDAPIMTPTGPVSMGSISRGSIVCTPNGKTAKVSEIFPQGKIDIYKVTFQDGSWVECCKDHLWKVKLRNCRHQADNWIVSTSYLLNKVKGQDGSNNISVETPIKVNFEKKKLLLDPYIMGLLIGDGTLGNEDDYENYRQLGFTSKDKQIVSRLKNYIKKDSQGECELKKSETHKYGYSIRRVVRKSGTNRYVDILKYYGLRGKKSEFKFIPKDFLYSSHEDRVKLLRGLMDTGGGISKNGMNPDYSTSSEQLAQDFKFLVESLGGIVTITSRIPHYKNKNGEKVEGLLAHRCWLKINLNPFSLKRKVKRVIKRSKYQKLYRIIDKIEYVEKKEAQCIALDDIYNLYMTNNFVVTHNSLCAKALGTQWGLPLISFDPSRIFSSRVGESEGNIRRVLQIVENVSPCLEGNTRITLSNGNVASIQEMYEKNYRESVPSFSSDFKMEDAKVVFITRKESDNLYNLKTSVGNIKATGNHKFPILRSNGELHWVNVEHIQEGDFILAPRRYMKNEHFNIFNYLEEDSRIYSNNLCKNLMSKIKKEDPEYYKKYGRRISGSGIRKNKFDGFVFKHEMIKYQLTLNSIYILSI